MSLQIVAEPQDQRQYTLSLLVADVDNTCLQNQAIGSTNKVVSMTTSANR
jgi:hypothetical protein